MAETEDMGKDSVFDADATLSTVEDVAIRGTFTPGPWRACDPSDNPHSQTVTADAVECDVCDVLGCATMEANARLIATAPEMHEALAAQEVAVNEHSKCECRRHPDDYLCSMCMACVSRYMRASELRRGALAKAVPGTDARQDGTASEDRRIPTISKLETVRTGERGDE